MQGPAQIRLLFYYKIYKHVILWHNNTTSAPCDILGEMMKLKL